MIEVVIAVGIVGIAAGAVITATTAAVHRFGPDPVRSALDAAVQREMRLAVDVLKYQDGSIAPVTVATSVPVPGASPIAAHLSIATTMLADGAIHVTLTATSDADQSKSATLESTIAQPAPLPASTIAAPALGAAPQ